jgi:plastocyanin
MLKRITSTCLMAALAAFLLVGCGGDKGGGTTNSGGATSTPGAATYKKTGDEGTIAGVIKFDGTPAQAKKIDMGADANCASASGDKTMNDLLVADGKLENVFIYVKGDAVDKATFDTPSSPVSLDQQGCRYHPRVLGIQTGQTLRVTNSDPTTHNVHPTPKNNQEWNRSQAPSAPPIEQKFNRAEILVPVKCNIHPWMKASIGVLGHPYFVVSGKDGAYSIKDLPPGSYTLVAWHETLGEQTQNITVGAKESKTQDFTFRAGQAYAPTSLKVEPVLILP